MKIGIVGMGYVGTAIAKLFHSFELEYYDIYKSGYKNDAEEINKCDISFVCVPTPEGDYGECSISAVEEVIEWIETPIIVLKSTVPPGTTDYLIKKYGKNIVFSPEYCGESKYWTPYKFHTEIIETPFFIFGGAKELTEQIVDLFMQVCGPVKTYRQTTAIEAEMAKYMENTFYATKITFCYEIAQICEHAGIDYNEVRELWLLDPRINPMHTAVFKKNEKPFSGKCLPKDLSALIAYSREKDYEPELLTEVRLSNERISDYIKKHKRSSLAS